MPLPHCAQPESSVSILVLSTGPYVQLGGLLSQAVVPCYWTAPDQAAQAVTGFGGSVPYTLDTRELPSETPTRTGSKQQRHERHFDSRTKAGRCAQLCY